VNQSCPRRIFVGGFLVMVSLLAACAQPDVTVSSRPDTLDPMQIFARELQDLCGTLRIPH